MEQQDTALLAGVDAPGSWAAERDSAILAETAARGERHSGLRFTVRDARAVTARGDAAAVVASVRLEPFRYTRAGATRTTQPSPERRERYELVWNGLRWLVTTVRAA